CCNSASAARGRPTTRRRADSTRRPRSARPAPPGSPRRKRRRTTTVQLPSSDGVSTPHCFPLFGNNGAQHLPPLFQPGRLNRRLSSRVGEASITQEKRKCPFNPVKAETLS